MFEVVKISTTSLDKDNFVGAQCDSFGEGSPYSELYMNGFFRSVPFDETDKGCSTGLQIFDGSDMFVLPGTDPRIIPLLPTASKGSSTQGAYNGTTCDFAHFDQSGFAVMVHDGANQHLIKVDKNTHTISIIQRDGSAIELSSGSATIRTSGGSVSVSGNKMQVFGDFAVTGSISQVGGKPVVIAPALLAYLKLLEAAVNAKVPIPGAAVPTPDSAALLVPGVGSTLNTLVN